MRCNVGDFILSVSSCRLGYGATVENIEFGVDSQGGGGGESYAG